MKKGLKVGLIISGVICFFLVVLGGIAYTVSNNYIKSIYFYNGENSVYGLRFDEVSKEYTVTDFSYDSILNEIDSGAYNKNNDEITLKSNTGNEILGIENSDASKISLSGIIDNKTLELVEFDKIKNIIELIKIVDENSKK